MNHPNAVPQWIVLGLFSLTDFLSLLLALSTVALASFTLWLVYATRKGMRDQLELQEREISARMCLTVLDDLSAPSYMSSRGTYYTMVKNNVLPANQHVAYMLDINNFLDGLNGVCALIRSRVLRPIDCKNILREAPWNVWPNVEIYAKSVREREEAPSIWNNLEWCASQGAPPEV